MSEESLPTKSQQPPALPDAEYDAIYATVSETAQGRRFLDEYARRCGPTDTEVTLAAIERVHAALRAESAAGQVDLLLEMAEMAQAIARARAEITAIDTPPRSGPAAAMEELDAIVHMTKDATSRILASAEQMQEIAGTLRESGADKTRCDLLDAQASEIYTACSFQDLTGQRVRKVIEVLRYLESRIQATVIAKELPPAQIISDHASLAQADVDVVMQPQKPAHRDRRDATLEDINRVMQSLEPSMTFHPAKPEPEPAAKPVVDVRPELSVVETVIAEADTALQLAEWAVDSRRAEPPPAAGEATPMVDWVVEDPSAPRPDSEPAWMILQRMEAEFDAAYEPEDAGAAFTPAPASPSVPAAAEPVISPQADGDNPEFFVPKEILGLASTLPPPSTPPPQADFRGHPPSPDPLTELQRAMEVSGMTLAQPFDDEARARDFTQHQTPTEMPPFAEAQTDALQPAPDVFAESIAEAIATPTSETSGLMKRAAAIAVRREVSAEDATPAAEPDPDDFLFAEAQEPADFLLDPAPRVVQPTQPMEAAQQEPAASQEWAAGTYPHPALVTPQTPQEPQATDAPTPEQAKPVPGDPLAPLRAMSDEEKIALFS